MQVNTELQISGTTVRDGRNGRFFANSIILDVPPSPDEASGEFDLRTGIGHAFTAARFKAGDFFVHQAGVSIFAQDTFQIHGDLPTAQTLTMHLNVNGLLQGFVGFDGPCEGLECEFFFHGIARIDGRLLISDLTDNQGYPIDFNFDQRLGTLPITKSYDIPFVVSDTHRNFEFSLAFHAAAARDAVVDFSNTAGVTLPLPAGFSLTSGSGVFLTQVPEAGVTAFFLAGLSLLGFATRRIRTKPEGTVLT